MRKISLLMLFALAFLFNANATEIWKGSQAVTWGHGLQIEASLFAGAQPGNALKVFFTNASDGIEFKANGVNIAGSRKNAWINDEVAYYELYLTPGAIDAIKAHGLEIVGANFTVTKVELNEVEGREGMTTMWRGLYWADGWDKDPMLFYPAIASVVDWNDYSAIRVYHEAGRSDFEVNFKKGWGKGDQIGGISDMTAGDGYVELPLTDERRALLASIDNELIVQFYRGGDDKAAFNVTEITLVEKPYLWKGNQHVSWEDGGLQIAADKFAGAQTGNLLKVHYANAATNIEFKAMNTSHDNLAGSRKNAWIEGEGVYEMYLSTLAVEAVKAYGLEICGGGFDVTEVELLEGRAAEAKDGSIWTGYSWADNVCGTLELDIEGFHNIDWYDYKQMIVYHQAGHTDYGVNVRTNWDSEGVIYETIAADKSADKIVIDLTQVDIPAIIAATNADRLMIQGCSSGEAFNITDIVLVMEEPYTRTVTNGNYGTICLPRASSVIEGATMYRIVDGNASEGITIEEVASMEAGKPYIFQATADQLTVTMTGARADVQAANGLIGNLGETAMDVPQNAYVLKNNKLYMVDNTSVTIAPNRAYIDLSGITTLAPAPGMKRRVIAAENQATGVDQVPSDQVQTTKILLNGQLFILRGGQLFDATGARVQ